jgi:hypothetical protein
VSLKKIEAQIAREKCRVSRCLFLQGFQFRVFGDRQREMKKRLFDVLRKNFFYFYTNILSINSTSRVFS